MKCFGHKEPDWLYHPIILSDFCSHLKNLNAPLILDVSRFLINATTYKSRDLIFIDTNSFGRRLRTSNTYYTKWRIELTHQNQNHQNVLTVLLEQSVLDFFRVKSNIPQRSSKMIDVPVIAIVVAILAVGHGYEIQSRILDGAKSDAQKYPFYVRLEVICETKQGRQNSTCGSTLLNNR